MWPLHIWSSSRRTCHAHRSRRWGVAVSMEGVIRRVLVSLHRARRILLRRERIAAGTAEGGSWGLSVWRGPWTSETRRSEIVGGKLLERRRRRPVNVGTRGLGLKRRGGCERAGC
jgi:hypothetical protein